MAYRQYADNCARSGAPIHRSGVLTRGVERVVLHYRLLLESNWPWPDGARLPYEIARMRADAFQADDDYIAGRCSVATWPRSTSCRRSTSGGGPSRIPIWSTCGRANSQRTCDWPRRPPFIIAEIGSNHNGSLDLALRLIDAARECGVDAVKFQSWSKSSLISSAEYARNTRYSGDGQCGRPRGGSRAVSVDARAAPRNRGLLPRHRRAVSLECLLARESVQLLDSLGVPAFKVASMDVTHLPLLAWVARRHKPVILSTGMATLGEIERALEVLRAEGSGPVVLLHCVSKLSDAARRGPPAEHCHALASLRCAGRLQRPHDWDGRSACGRGARRLHH